MTTLSLRNRYLAALGLSGSVLSGCSSNEPGGTTPTTTTELTAVATSEPTATAVATATAVESAKTPIVWTSPIPTDSVAFWEPTVLPPPPKVHPKETSIGNMPSCPNGQFCVAEANATGSAMAAAPFAKCAVEASDPERRGTRSIHFDQKQTQRERTKTKDACCYTWFISCPGGRPLMVGGTARVADPAASQNWVGSGTAPQSFAALSFEQRSALADHYAAEAAYEHASIAAFARVSLALLAVGAPADLVADTHRAALDEIRHAEAMYRLASAYRGESVGPSALSLDGASLSASIVALATEAFIEGCVGEVAAALVLREEATRAADESTRAVIASLASDEERHAELAWRTVAWALAQAPAAIRASLLQSRAALVAELLAALPATEPALPFVTSARERVAIRKQAIREVVLPCLAALLTRDVA